MTGESFMITIPHHSICQEKVSLKRTTYCRNFIQAVHLSNTIINNIWSPVIFKDGLRRKANFLYSDWCVLDFDSGEMSVEEARDNVFCDMAHIIGTTKSHRPNHHRFRVCLLFETRVTNLSQYEATLKHMIDRFGADPQAKDGARFFYPCSKIISIERKGYRVKVSKTETRKVAKVAELARPGVKTAYVNHCLKRAVIPHGERDIVAFRVALDLAKAGFDDVYISSFISKELRFEGPIDFLVSDKIRSARKTLERRRYAEN